MSSLVLSVAPYVHHAVLLARRRAAERGIVLEAELAYGAPMPHFQDPKVRADPLELEALLAAMIDTALRGAQDGARLVARVVKRDPEIQVRVAIAGPAAQREDALLTLSLRRAT